MQKSTTQTSAQYMQQQTPTAIFAHGSGSKCSAVTRRTHLTAVLLSYFPVIVLLFKAFPISNNISNSISSLPADTPYLTLSHSWGTVKFTTLLHSNIHQFRKSTPVTTLSSTFQDALYVVANLDFQYLWIDSLCSIQDSRADWDHESKRMGDIYTHAACNLTASASTKGFLTDQRARTLIPPSLHVRISMPRLPLFLNLIIIESSPWDEIWTAPLFNRAWVLQEQLLATRAIHFGRDQLFWECRQSCANEIYPLGWKSDTAEPLARDYSEEIEHRPFWQFAIESIPDMRTPPYDIWRHIVQHYSGRQLTYDSDRLPALSGFASVFSRLHPQDQYRFGLWQGDLHHGLLWQRSSSVSNKRQPDWSQAPSWSWASLNDGVEWDQVCYDRASLDGIKSMKRRFVGTIISVSTYTQSSTPTYSLTLCGPLLRLDGRGYDTASVSQRNIFIGLEAHTLSYEFDKWFYTSRVGSLLNHNHEGSNDAEKVKLSLEGVFCFPLVSRIYHEKSPKAKTYRIDGILLVKHTEERGGRSVYRRVGIVRIRVYEDVAKGYREHADSLASLKRYQTDFKKEDFRKYDGYGNYTIEII